MTTLLVVTGNPSTYTTGNWPANDMNSLVWEFTFTTTATSASGTYGGFNVLFATPLISGTSGGLWITSERLEYYDIDDNLVFQSAAMVFGVGAVLRFKIDEVAQQYTISGATSGNGTVGYTASSPYFRAAETLGAGVVPGEVGFDLPGTFGNVTDGAAGDSIIGDAGTFALTGGAVTLAESAAIVAAAGAFTLTGGAADLSAGISGVQIDADAGSFTLTGGAANLIAVARVDAVAGSFALATGDADLQTGDSVIVGDHGLDAQPFPFSDRDALISLDTQVGGSVVVVLAGGQSSDITQTWTDSLGNTIRKLAAVQEYPDFPGYGTQAGITQNPMTGGAGHQFTVQVEDEDENTSFAVEVIGGRRVKFLHVNDNNAGAGTTLGIGPIAVDGPAVLIAGWFGSHPVNPPFSGSGGPNGTGTGAPFTAVPDNGFTVVQSYLFNFEFGEVQGACAVKEVTAAGSQSVTWTHGPAQGAQLWLIAVEGGGEVAAESAAFALVGGAASLDASASVTIDADAAAFALTGGAATVQAAGIVAGDAGAFAMAGGAATLDAVAAVQADAATYAFTGGDATLLSGARVTADAGAFALAGGDAALLGAAAVTVDAGAFVLSGGEVAIEGQGDETIVAAAGTFSMTGGEAELDAVAGFDAEAGTFVLAGGDATIGTGIDPIPPLPPRAPEDGPFAQLVAVMDRLITEHLG